MCLTTEQNKTKTKPIKQAENPKGFLYGWICLLPQL